MHDGVFRALAHPTRRRILERLVDGDLTAGEIAADFPVAFASVSHHLGVLKAAGLVTATREGQHLQYRMSATALRETVRYLMDRFGESPSV
jgi:DNA-binding transcriptional ArsR family regulator